MASKKCIRCESLERKQKSKKITLSGPSGSIPLCSVCIQELVEMDMLFRDQEEEEDEQGGEGFDI